MSVAFLLLSHIVFLASCFVSCDNPNCFLTQRLPQDPKVALRFCVKGLTSKSCCLPVFDSYISYVFKSLIQSSTYCEHSQTDLLLALKYLYCFGCDPDQPKYMKINHTEIVNGVNVSYYEIRICNWLAQKVAPQLFSCAINLATNRSLPCAGSGPVDALKQWGSGLNGISKFLNDDVGAKPPLFEDTYANNFYVTIVPDDKNCYGTSQAFSIIYSTDYRQRINMISVTLLLVLWLLMP